MKSAKLKRSNSSKWERRVGEILKNNRIKFRAKVRIGKYEVDFLIGKVVIEVDGSVHKKTNTQKDIFLFNQGYTPLHLITHGRKAELIEQTLINLIHNNGYK